MQVAELRLVHVDKLTACHFDTAFRAVSEQAHVLIVSEGTPLLAHLSDEQVTALEANLHLDSPLPLNDVICRLAEAYDYFVEQPNPDTFLLRKLYTDPADLPCVTYDEITHSLRSVLQVVDAYSPATAPATYETENQLFESLTPEQAQRAKSNLPFADLLPQQQELALATLKQLTVETRVNAVRQLARTLAIVDRRSTVFKWVDAERQDLSHTTAFGLEGEFGAGNAVTALPISFPFKPSGGSGYISLGEMHTSGRPNQIPADAGYTMTEPSFVTGNLEGYQVHIHSAPPDKTAAFLSVSRPGTLPSILLNPSDPTTPTDIDRKLAEGMLVNRLPSTMTLREAAEKAISLPEKAVTARRRASSVARCDVDAAIAEKPVNVFGAEFGGGGSSALQALANVYGLQLAGDSSQNFVLEVPKPRTNVDPINVSAEMERLIPLPLVRSYLARKSAQAKNDLYFAAVRRLIALAEPAIPTAASPPVQITAAGPEAERLIALALLSGEPFRQLMALENYVPSRALLQPDTLRMTMRRDTSGPRSYLNLSFGDMSGYGHSYNAIANSSSMLMPAKTPVSGMVP